LPISLIELESMNVSCSCLPEVDLPKDTQFAAMAALAVKSRVSAGMLFNFILPPIARSPLYETGDSLPLVAV
jgi:hypothetical protein